MAVAFQVSSMQLDLKSFAKAVGKEFIINTQRLLELESQLSVAVAEAKRGDRTLVWTTDVGAGPIRTVPTRNYRVAGGDKTIIGELSFKFSGSLDPHDDDRLVMRSGNTRVRLCWDGSEGEVLYRFDIHLDAAGHPMLHVQCEGAISEVPRLHSFLVHPLDILEFTVMEVFQGKWRDIRTTAKFGSELRKYPANQRKRVAALLAGYEGLLKSTDPALIALLGPPGSPVELYPA